MRKVVGIFILLLFQYGYAQVGINTTDPQEALDVNGKIRVTDTDVDDDRTMVSIIGIDNNETLSKMNLSPDFVITNNTITVSGTYSYSVINIDFTDPADVALYLEDYEVGVDIVDLDLGLDGINAQETVVRLIGMPDDVFIAGITGGVPGRHILFLNATTTNKALGVRDESIVDPNDEDLNKILTYGVGTAKTQGQGAIELVYDGFRWVVLNIRN